MYKLKELKRSINNLFVWFKIVWQDRQWDHAYIESMLLHKLKLMKQYHEKRKYFVGVENEIKWMGICMSLLERLENCKYWDDEYNKKKPSKNGIVLTPWAKDKLEKDTLYFGYLWEEKTRRLFWKIFVWRYEYWWD